MNFPENKDSFILKCHTMSTGKEFSTFRRNVGFSSTPSGSPRTVFFTLKMKVLKFFETLVII